MPTALDALVRRVDEDRWLASRFAPALARAKLTALYAVNYELARTSEVVREPGVGAIRLAWWREAIAELAQAMPARAHPALAALAESWGEGVDARMFSEIVEARAHDLDGAPFENADALRAYVDATAGNVMRLAMRACAPESLSSAEAFVAYAGRAWGLAGLARAGRQDLAPGVDLSQAAEVALGEARRLAPALASAAFPAVGYAALLPGYLRALRARRPAPSFLARQFKIIAASATGRF